MTRSLELAGLSPKDIDHVNAHATATPIGDTLEAAAALDPDRSEELDFSGHGAALAVTLFLARPDGLPVAEVSEVIRAAATAELPPAEAILPHDGAFSPVLGKLVAAFSGGTEGASNPGVDIVGAAPGAT